MEKLIYATNTSLDGFTEDATGYFDCRNNKDARGRAAPDRAYTSAASVAAR